MENQVPTLSISEGDVPGITDNEIVENENMATNKRKKGGQPGNSNPFKHGLYMHHKRIRNTNPIEKAALYNLTDHIRYLQDYLQYLYEIGKKSTDIEVINNTARSLALGYRLLLTMLCRGVHIEKILRKASRHTY